MSELSFCGKVVLVPGAGSTSGSELAKYFSKLGATLVLTDRDKYRLNKVGDECGGNPIVKIAADLTKNEDATNIIEQAIREFGKIDVLINYVGPLDSNTVSEETKVDAFQFMMNIGVCSVHCLTQLAFPHLVKTHGNVVIVNDLLTSDVTTCNVVRSALNELTKSLASEFMCKGVRVNAINAGSTVDVEIAGKPNDKPSVLPTRIGPEAIAAAVVFLGSDLASYVVGAIIPVDGGKHLGATRETAAGKHSEKISSASKVSALNAEPTETNARKKEHSHASGNNGEHSKKLDQVKQQSMQNDLKKPETDKTATPKEKMSGKSASKNVN